MPRSKTALAKKSSETSILNYFTTHVGVGLPQKRSYLSDNEEKNKDMHRGCKSRIKRKAAEAIIQEKPKKSCTIVNSEPIVISSDDYDSESDILASSAIKQRSRVVELPDTQKHELRHDTYENFVKTLDKENLISECSSAQLQGVLLQIPNKQTNPPYEDKPIETDTAGISAEESFERSDGGKIAYYHLNFCHVLDTVLHNDEDRGLFENSDDMNWIDEFKNLPLPAQKLYVRLYHRKMAWLRHDQINYPNIAKDNQKILECLTSSGFILSLEKHASTELNLDQVLKLLPAPSLKDIAKSFKVSVTGLHKKDITAEICKMCRQQRSLIHGFMPSKSRSSKAGLEGNVMKRALKALGSCYKVATDPRKVFNRVLLVFDVTRGIDDELDCTLTGSKNAVGQGRHLQLSAMLMAGMGKVCYPEFKVNRGTPIFKRRIDLLQYETAFQFQMDVLACIESGKWEDASVLCDSANVVNMELMLHDPESASHAESLPSFLRSFTAPWVYVRLRSLEVEILQRLKDYSKAVDILRELLDQNIYCQSRRGHWWERLALNVDQHLKDPIKSMNIIHESLTDPNVRVGHKLALAERADKILASKAVVKFPKLKNLYEEKLKPITIKLNIHEAPVVEITGCLLPTELQSGKSRFVTEIPDDDGTANSSSTILCSVEELALSHYKSIGYPYGIHGEGGTFMALFCLFFWDIIFMDGIPDVFRTSYQTHPLDYHTDGFYAERQEEIEKRLRGISDLVDSDFQTENQEFCDKATSVIDMFTSTWDMEYGKACTGMAWDRFSNLEEALELVRCIGGKTLSGIFRRLAKDLRHTRSGMPDLVVWNPTRKIYKLAEVKGPGDRLSTNQKLWIDELISLDANVEVCKVIAIGGKKVSRN